MKIGLFGSCQLYLTSNFFFNNEINKKYDLEIMFSLPFYEYDKDYALYKGIILDYTIFDNLDCLIIENNNLECEASSKKIIDYCLNKNIKIIKTFLIKFPIFPINWSGYGENKNDYINWDDLNNIDYKLKFKKCIESCVKDNSRCDLSMDITNFIETNFNKKLLFTHSLHPTNILLYELWRQIFRNININIDDYNYILNNELILWWNNPFTSKMITDLNIEFNVNVDDNFYINKYNTNKDLILSNMP